MPDEPLPQMNIKMPREMRAQLVAVARVLGEGDELGDGASAVMRRLAASYLAEHKADIPDWWRKHL